MTDDEIDELVHRCHPGAQPGDVIDQPPDDGEEAA